MDLPDFTPIQNKLLRELMQTAEKIYVTVTLDAWEDPMKKVSMHKLSYLSKKDDTAAGRGGKRMWLYAGKSGSARKRRKHPFPEVHRHFAFWRDICSDRAIRFMKPEIHRSWSGAVFACGKRCGKQRQNLRHGRSGIWCVKRICVTGILP